MASGIYPLINVSSLDKTLEWYKGLGLKTSRESQGPMTWGNVESGDNKVVVFPKDGPVDIEQPTDTKTWLSGELGKGVMITIGVPNATKTWAKAQAMRMTVDSPLRDQPWGGTGFTVVDPDGYVVNISDKFPGAPQKRVAKKAPKQVVKKVVKTAKKVAKKVAGKKR